MMNRVKVTTAAELERMTMADREAHLEASIELDLANVPDAFLAKVRSRLQARIDANVDGE